MARVYRLSSSNTTDSRPIDSPLLEKFIQFEVIAGALLLALGGFILRSQGTYALILVGATMLVLGSYRLWRRAEPSTNAGPIEEDRVIRSLEHKLSANYSLVVDFPVSETETIPYLVIGPPGVFVLNPWTEQSTVREGADPGEWVLVREDETEETVENPVVENERRIHRLEALVDTTGMLGPVQNVVVLLGRRADDPPLQVDEVLEMNELPGFILDDDREAVLDWEDVDEIERQLDLK